MILSKLLLVSFAVFNCGLGFNADAFLSLSNEKHQHQQQQHHKQQGQSRFGRPKMNIDFSQATQQEEEELTKSSLQRPPMAKQNEKQAPVQLQQHHKPPPPREQMYQIGRPQMGMQQMGMQQMRPLPRMNIPMDKNPNNINYQPMGNDMPPPPFEGIEGRQDGQDSEGAGEGMAPCHGSDSSLVGNVEDIVSKASKVSQPQSIGSLNTINSINSLNSFGSGLNDLTDSSVDISFDSMMNDIINDVLYLELMSSMAQQAVQQQQQQVSQSSKINRLQGLQSSPSQSLQQQGSLVSQQNSMKSPRGGMILLLNNPKKVSSDTYRFNINQSQQKPARYFHETEIVYLCKKQSCRESERFEMTTISSSYSPKSGKFRMHLTPTTTAAPLLEDKDNNNNINNNIDIEDRDVDDMVTFELGSEASTEAEFDPSNDLILIEITVIIVIIIVCGVGYALFRCVVDKRDNKRELKALMQHRSALLDNDMKTGGIVNDNTGRKSSGRNEGVLGGNIPTINENFNNAEYTLGNMGQ